MPRTIQILHLAAGRPGLAFAAAALAAILCGMLLAPPEKPLVGTANVVDGDTLHLDGNRVRLLGIDAPELDQTCLNESGDRWTCGQAARDALRALTRGQAVSCAPAGRDRYDRLLARCFTGDVDLGLAVLRAGLAVADGDYLSEESQARAAGKGIWNGSFVPPAQWRAGQRRNDDRGGLWAALLAWFH